MDFTARDRLRFLAALGTASLAACAGGGVRAAAQPSTTPALRDVFAADFDVGAAVQTVQITGGGIDQRLAETHFSSFTSEYEMKADIVAPTPGEYNFAPADTLLAFARANRARVRGHALLWYRSTPDYFTTGNANAVRDRLETYIADVAGRYAGQIEAWDVVNEVISDRDSEVYRQDDWLAAAGTDYIDWAFQAARAADPQAKLFINEYSTEFVGKRERFISVIRDLLDRGIPLDGVGHQLHLNHNIPAEQVLEAIDAIDALGAGLEQHITELDISVYSDRSKCFHSDADCQASHGRAATDVPDQIYRQQAQLYRDLFEGFKARDSVTSVSVWGIRDSQSWLNNFPISRSNYPLLFDPDGHPKSATRAITDPSYVIP